MTVHLAAFHGEVDLVAAVIAGHDLEARAEELIHHRRIDVRDGAFGGRARDGLALARILDAEDARRVPHRHGLVDRRDRPQPRKFRGVELNARQAGGLRGREGILAHSDIGAVTRRLDIEVVLHLEAARAGHILRDDARVARNVPPDMLGHQPGLQIVFAAGAHADQHIDGLATIEVGHGIGLCARRRQSGNGQQRRSRERAKGRACAMSRHGSFLPILISEGHQCPFRSARKPRPSIR